MNDTTVRADWYPDPYHRHEFRYWDGQAWTSHASDHGQAVVDEVGRAIVDSRLDVMVAPTGDYTPGCDYFRGTLRKWGGHTERGDDFLERAVIKTVNKDRVSWENTIVNGETPAVLGTCKLATDRALYFSVSTLRHPSVVHERYEFARMSNLDEKGFDYEGTRVKKKWIKKGRIDERFYWLLFERQPQLAARFLVQQSEIGVPLTHRPVKMGCVTSASATPVFTGMALEHKERIETETIPTFVEIVVSRDRDLYDGDDYFQFVACPVCGDHLRLHITNPLDQKRSHVEVVDSASVGIRDSTVAHMVKRHSILDQQLF